MAEVVKLSVPVEFKDTSQSYKGLIAQLESELKKIKPGTAIYDGIANQIKSAKKLMDKVDLDLDLGITKQSDISRIGKDFSQLRTILERVGHSFKSIDVRDLNINEANFGDLAKQLSTAHQEMARLQSEMKKAKGQSVSELLAGDQKALNLFDAKDITKGGLSVFDSLKDKIEQTTQELNQAAAEADNLNQKLQKLEGKQKKVGKPNEAGAAAELFYGITGKSDSRVGDMRTRLYEQIASSFRADGSWRANANRQATEAILAEFGLDPKILEAETKNRLNIIQEAINSVTGKTFNTVRSKYSKTARDNVAATELSLQIEQTQSDINKQNALQTGLGEKGQLGQLQKQFEALRKSLINAGVIGTDGALSSYDTAINALQAEIEEIQVQLRLKGPQAAVPMNVPSLGGMAEDYEAQLEAKQFTDNLKQSIKHWMSAQQVVNIIKDGIRQAVQDIRGLDSAMTNIAVVTDMSVGDLWGKIDEYMSIAQQYGVSTQGVYEVSQLYYQQGLGAADVMAATTETLKMARIAGMDYADAADAMTVAIRSFKMEMTDAAHVTDVYSKVAAVTASDSEELAIAMSKTASSAESVGSSFENTTAMLAVMIETTRESAQNLGSALKSIISRYGEMKVGATVDAEGEALDYNKVDTALKSVGISIKDAQGQFRDFDDVIFELSSKWDALDKNTQRYIATIMAGNRQQSRFIALVDNWERLEEVAGAAEDSEDAGLLQYAKTLDSLETKLNNIKTSFQQFYMSIFNGPLIGKGLDFINDIIQGFNKLSKFTSILNIASIVSGLKLIGTIIVNTFSSSFGQISAGWKQMLQNLALSARAGGQQAGQNFLQGSQSGKGAPALSRKATLGVSALSLLGTGLSFAGSAVAGNNQEAGAWMSGIGSGIQVGTMIGMINPIAGAIAGLVTAIVSIATSIPSELEKAQQKAEKAQEKANEANIKRAQAKEKYTSLDDYITKLRKLETTRFDSEESYNEWIKVNAEALETFPELASSMDAAKNAIVDLNAAEQALAHSRIEAAEAAKRAADANMLAALAEQQKVVLEQGQKISNIASYVKPQETAGILTNSYNNIPMKTSLLNKLTGTKTYSREELEALGVLSFTKGDLVGESWKGNQVVASATRSWGRYTDAYELYFSNDALNEASKYIDTENVEALKWLIQLGQITDGLTSVQEAGKSFSSKYLKKGATEQQFFAAFTNDQVTTAADAAGLKNTAQREIDAANLLYETTLKSSIASYVESSLLFLDESEKQYEELSGVNKIFQDKLYEGFNEYKNKEENQKLDPETLWTNWTTLSDGYNETFNHWSGIFKKAHENLKNSGNLEAYNQLVEQSDSYTYTEYEGLLNDYSSYIDEELKEYLRSKMQTSAEQAKESFDQALTNIKGSDKKSLGLESFTLPKEYYDDATEYGRQLETWIANGMMGDNTARTLWNNYKNLWTKTEGIQDANTREKARIILSNADFTSLEGIANIYNSLQKEGITTITEADINKLIPTSLVNLTTSYQSLMSKVASNIDAQAAQLKKAQDGFSSLEETTEFANKIGVTLDDFDFIDGKWYLKQTEGISDKIKNSVEATYQQELDLLNKEYDKQSEVIKNYNENLSMQYTENDQGIKTPVDVDSLITSLNLDTTNEQDQQIANILRSNWNNYATWLQESNDNIGKTFLEYLQINHADQLESLTTQGDAYTQWLIDEFERDSKIKKLAVDLSGGDKAKRKQEALNTIASKGLKGYTADEIALLRTDLGIASLGTKQADGTFDITLQELGEIDTWVRNAILASTDSEVESAKLAIEALGSEAAGKADAGVYYKALKESGLSYDILETLIPENIRLAAQGNENAEEALKGVLEAANIEDVDTVYNNLINNYFDTTKANVFTALDSIEKALDGTLDAQEFTELKTLDFGSYKIDFSTIKSSGELTLERYWQTIAEVIRSGASETDWGQYFEKAAKRSFDSAFGLEELEFDKEVAEASGKFSQKLITNVAKQAKQILSPDVLSKFFVYDKITETYSANIQAIMAEAKLTEAEARSQWALQASVLMGFDYNAVMASFAGQDYAKLVKTDSIESSLNKLIAAPSNITLENIKSLYEEIYGAGTFVVNQDVATIDGFIQQAQEGAYDQVIGYIRNLYNEAISAGYNVDTGEITTLIQQFYESIAKNLKSALSDGIEGNLDTTTYNDLVKKYNVSGIKTTTGYGLTDDSQQKIISEWYKAAQTSGSILGFGEELWKTWADSTEAPLKSYRAISAEIEKAINKTDGLVSATDEYVAALQQARAAAYLDPNAYEFSFMEQDATGGLTENFDSFVSQIDTVKTTLNSLKSGTAIGYQEFYNLIDFIDNSGQWDIVSQKLGQGGKDIQEFANTIVEASGELGKVDAKGFAEIGLDMAASSEAMTEGMADGLKEVANDQIKYLTGLENMLLAMQALSEIGDISLGLSLDVNGQTMDVTLSQLDDFKAQLLKKYPIEKINHEINQALTGQASIINSGFEQIFGLENFDFMQLFFGGSFDFDKDTEIQMADALGTYLSILPNLTKDQAMSVGEQLLASVSEGLIRDEQGNITGINESFYQLFTNFFQNFDASKISGLSSTAIREALGTAIEKTVEINGKAFTIKLGENGAPKVEIPNGITIDESNKKEIESQIAAALGLEQVSIDLDSLEIKGLSKDKSSDTDNTLEVTANISPELQAVLNLINDDPTITIALSDEAWALLEALQPETAKALREQAERLKKAANLYKQDTQPGRDALHAGEQEAYAAAIATAKETNENAQAQQAAEEAEKAEQARKAEEERLKKANLYKQDTQPGRDALHAGEQEAYAKAMRARAIAETSDTLLDELAKSWELFNPETTDGFTKYVESIYNSLSQYFDNEREYQEFRTSKDPAITQGRDTLSAILSALNKGGYLADSQYGAGLFDGKGNFILPDSFTADFSSLMSQVFGGANANQEDTIFYKAQLEISNSYEELMDQAGEIPSTVTITEEGADEAESAINDVQTKANDLANKSYVVHISAVYNFPDMPEIEGQWTGNMNNISGAALAEGNVHTLLQGARLANKTLVGELGPELAVYGGKYHMLGANGAEFVNLPSDAIVFNHLQTAGILQGQMNVRGKALAEGNVSGPALASGDGIGTALSAVRRAKAVWQGLLDNLSAAELIGAGGGGGGGGNELKAITAELQEWYNLSRQIAYLEQEINNLVAERENITDGSDYLKNLRETQKLLEQQKATQALLLDYQTQQLKRQADFINQHSIWGKYLTIDESGLLQYIDGNETNGGKGALEILQSFNEMSGQEQQAYLKKVGYSFTDQDGKALKGSELAQKFIEQLQEQIDQYDALYDTVHETEETIEGINTSIEEINDEIKQNQMDLEEAIYDIIVDAWEAEIEQMQEQADLIKEANDAYVKGLQDALNTEKELYSENQSIEERESLQRQLSLLRRSGGSASEIASLEEQLDSALKDEYFRNQEEMISNIEEANENQNELLEQQIKLQEDALEYQKENGVIWTKVYEVMARSENEILDFMQGKYPDFFSQSLLQQEEMLTDWAMKIGIYTADQQYKNHEAFARKSIWDSGKVWESNTMAGLKAQFDNLSDEEKENLKSLYASTYANEMTHGSGDDAISRGKADQEIEKYLNEKRAKEEAANKIPTSNGNGSSGSSGEVWTFSYNGKTYTYEGKANAENKINKLHSAAISQLKAPTGIAAELKPGEVEGYNKAWQDYNAKVDQLNALKNKAKSSLKRKSYSQGGLVDYTGTAVVHGSPSKPEAFLNAAQTAQISEALRITNGKESLLESLRSTADKLKTLIHNISTIDKSTNQDITIAPGAVVIQVEQLADTYDIEELSNDVFNRIVTISSKATNRGVNRR